MNKKCLVHPRYKGIRKPTCRLHPKCSCLKIWQPLKRPLNAQRDQNISALREHGYFSMANPELARQYLADYQRIVPELRMIDGVGEYGVGQILFLPHGYDYVRKRIEHELEQISRQHLAIQTAYQNLLNYGIK